MEAISRRPRGLPIARFAAILGLVIVTSMPAQGQEKAAPAAAADDLPEANPSRPTVSTTALLTPVGYLQFENGGLYATGSGDFESTFGLSQVTKLTVIPRLQFFWNIQPVAFSKVAGARTTDKGDVFAGVQGIVRRGAGTRPTIGLSYVRRLYEGPAANLDIGSNVQSILLLVSADIGKFHYDTNAILTEQTDHRVRRAQVGQTFSVSHPAGKFSVSAELWRFSEPLTGGNAVGNLYALGYTPRKNLVLDAGFNKGLTSTSTGWEGFAGFTYVLPHRLWKGRPQ